MAIGARGRLVAQHGSPNHIRSQYDARQRPHACMEFLSQPAPAWLCDISSDGVLLPPLHAAGYAAVPNPLIAITAAAFFFTATILIPGYMSHYCVDFNIAQMFNVYASFAHVRASGRAYWHAWTIALAALALSFSGILFLGVGFLFTSVWFWQVAGFSFATVMAQRHELTMPRTDQQ